MYADMQKCHKAAHKNIKTGSGILTVDEAKILLKSHPEYILPQDSRMIHLLQIINCGNSGMLNRL